MATNPQTQNNNKAGDKEPPRVHSFMRDDFPAIRKATVIFLLCIVIGAALVTGSQYLLDNQLEAVAQAQAQDNKSRDTLRQAENERDDMRDFQPKFMQLAARGFVGTEKRLDWMESILAIQKNARLQPINYEISEQQIFQVDPSIAMGALELRGSKMLVKMNLLHEVDLLVFLDELKKGQLYDLQNCTITRLPEPAPGKLAPLLSAECALYWVTIGQQGENANPVNPSGL
jgi:hypothetical protein